MPPLFFCRVPPLRQALDFSASHYVILLAKCRSISLFPTSATKALGAFRGYANPSKLSAPDHCISGSLNIFANDDERPSVKKPTQGIGFPIRLPPRTGGRKTSKSIVAPNASSSETAEIPCRDIETKRCKLERLPVDEPAFLKPITQAGTEEVPVDQIVRCASSLMGIARVSWNEAVAMLTKAPSILNLEVSRLEQSVAFLTDVGLSKEDISSLLVSHPRFFDYDIEEMKRNVEYLISIGIPEDDVAIVFRERPQALNARMEDVIFIMECLLEAKVLPEDFARILSRSPAELFSSSARDYLKSRFHFFKQIGLHGSSLGKGIARKPNLLRFDLEAMKEAYSYLSKFLPPSDVSKLVRRFAEVLILDTKRKMEPMVNHLLQLGVNPSHLGKVLLRRPQLLGYTVAGLEPTVQYLKELGVAGQTLGRVICISPQVITLNCEEKLKPAVEFLRSIGLQDSKDMEQVLLRSGQLLRCSIDKNLAPKFSFFRDMGLKREDVVKILVLFPSMFGQSIELALEPKYRYLVDVMQRIPEEIVDFPQYFGYSLEKRIKPRYEKLIAKGVTNLSLSSMFACLEADFVSRYLTGTPRLRTCNKVKKGVRKSKCAG